MLEDLILSALKIGITITDFNELDVGMITDLLTQYQNNMPTDEEDVVEATEYDIANF